MNAMRVVAFGLPVGDLFNPKLECLLSSVNTTNFVNFSCGYFFSLHQPFLVDSETEIKKISDTCLFRKRQQYIHEFKKHNIDLTSLKASTIIDSRILPIDCGFLDLVERLPPHINRSSKAIDLCNYYSFDPCDLKSSDFQILIKNRMR